MISGFDVKKIQDNLEKIKEEQKLYLKGIENILVRGVRNRFKDEEDPDGNKWKELSKITLDMRRKGKGSKQFAQGTVKILQDTARLKNSIIGKSNDNIIDYDNLQVSVGTNVEYAKIHQQGGVSEFNGNIVKVPQRKFLGFSNIDNQNIERFTKSFINKIKKLLSIQ